MFGILSIWLNFCKLSSTPYPGIRSSKQTFLVNFFALVIDKFRQSRHAKRRPHFSRPRILAVSVTRLGHFLKVMYTNLLGNFFWAISNCIFLSINCFGYFLFFHLVTLENSNNRNHNKSFRRPLSFLWPIASERIFLSKRKRTYLLPHDRIY